MLSFLIKVNKLGSIEQVIWSEPRDAVMDDGASVYQLFSRDSHTPLLRALKKSAHTDGAFFCEKPLTLRDKPNILSVCIVSMGKRCLVFGAERQMYWDDESVSWYQALIAMFMDLIRSFVAGAVPQQNAAPGNEQTEMIQTLVGELKNRKQLLEDVNEKLNDANQDLNNRLVQDSLTGLVSRYQYRAEIEYRIGRSPGKLGIFVFIDVDDFKSVNDKYGHATGDQFLVEFADRLKSIPVDDMVRMRIAGDEFGLFIFGLEDAGRAAMEKLWQQIKAHALSKPIDAAGRKLPVSVSAGMSVYGRDTEDIYELIEYADRAMYAAKRKGKNRYCAYEK